MIFFVAWGMFQSSRTFRAISNPWEEHVALLSVHTPHACEISEGMSILHPVRFAPFGGLERWKTPRLSLRPRCHPRWPRGRPRLYLASQLREKKKQARPGHSINKGPRSWERRQSLSKENNRRADPERPEKTNTADENAAASERLISGQMQLFPLAPLSAVSSRLLTSSLAKCVLQIQLEFVCMFKQTTKTLSDPLVPWFIHTDWFLKYTQTAAFDF